MNDTPTHDGGARKRKPRNNARREEALEAQKRNPDLSYHKALAATARSGSDPDDPWPSRMEFHPDRWTRAAESLLRASEHLEAQADRSASPAILRLAAHEAAYLSSACMEAIEEVRRNDVLMASGEATQGDGQPKLHITRKQFPGALPDDPPGPDLSHVVDLLRTALEEVWRPNVGRAAIGAAAAIGRLAAWAEHGTGAAVFKCALEHRGGPALVADVYSSAGIPVPAPENGSRALIDPSTAKLGDVVRSPTGVEGVVFGTGLMLVSGGDVLPIGDGARVYPARPGRSSEQDNGASMQ
ncbi:hypothetical protein [Mycobacteroides abscessus]|uniref:hypothetical protein n=1 Tax=Mycobacteroides abscessus TaxID=36809 RepID=UPI0012FEAB8A|nr:hypothetical protein [Mycobacteroides abscessus]